MECGCLNPSTLALPNQPRGSGAGRGCRKDVVGGKRQKAQVLEGIIIRYPCLTNIVKIIQIKPFKE